MDFNNGDFFGGGEPSRRDKLEIGNDGKSRAERNKEKNMNRQQDYMDMGSSGGKFGGRGGRLKNKFGRRRGRGVGGSTRGRSGNKGLDLLIGLVLILIPIGLVVMLFTGNLTGMFRSFLATPEQNQTAFYQGIYDMQQANHDLSLTKEEQEQVAIYRKNEISRVEFIDKQTYPEYLVYVYSNSESKNEPFNDFVLESEAYGFPVPIFRISADLTRNYFITDTAGEDEPVFLIFRNNTGEITYDSMVNDPDMFDKLDPYMREIIKEDDEYFKNRTGSYGEAEWINRTPDTEQEEGAE